MTELIPRNAEATQLRAALACEKENLSVYKPSITESSKGALADVKPASIVTPNNTNLNGKPKFKPAAWAVAERMTQEAEATKQKAKSSVNPKHPEIGAIMLLNEALEKLASDKVKFGYLRDHEDQIFIVAEGVRVPLSLDLKSRAQNRFLLRVCDRTNSDREAQIMLKRWEVLADDSAEKLTFKRFSTISRDQKRIYVPVADGQILKIERDKFVLERNGDSQDKFWLEFPLTQSGAGTFTWEETDPKPGLADFERLCINTMSTDEPGRWLCAMHEGLFPFVREVVRTRAIMVHTGPTQNGKTTAAERFSMMHGLGEVKTAENSVAATRNAGDAGYLIIDNLEQKQLTEARIAQIITLSTGGEDARSSRSGTTIRAASSRPIAVITAIEGINIRPELTARTIEVHFEIKSGQKDDRDRTVLIILDRRDAMECALMHVLREWLRVREEGKTLWFDSTRPQFTNYFQLMCELIVAYERVAGKPEGWAKSIYSRWESTNAVTLDDSEDALDYPIYTLLSSDSFSHNLVPNNHWVLPEDAVIDGRPAILYVTEAAAMVSKLQSTMNDAPRSATALVRRLNGGKFQRWAFLATGSHPSLRRTSTKRPIGFAIYKSDAPAMIEGQDRPESRLGLCRIPGSNDAFDVALQ
ncbi:MAG TPA: hypothetical protein VK699_05520 [Terriglobales bacterium]|jgi:hypothetical protein|nr:hypothetical protein [Terriglobales bacterium]